ncbi:MAG: bifunctional 2-polyprenyl-6-hydroxyphenol methylase/3-demethylubiquinol 3-O-methyltransferase UbiG [Pseudomonadota bacterium]
MLNDQTIYNAAADRWWTDAPRWVRALHSMVPARLAWFDQFLDWKGADILDLGAAGGFMSEALHDRGARVTGIDPAAQAIAAATAHARQTGRETIRYDVGVGEALPYQDRRFDAVVCVDVLEHVTDLAKVLAETARVLKPGGWFLFDTINRNPLARLVTVTLAERLLGVLPRGTHDPAMFIRPAELRVQLAAQGLAPGPMTGFGPVWIGARGQLRFARLPGTAIMYMGAARRTPAQKLPTRKSPAREQPTRKTPARG